MVGAALAVAVAFFATGAVAWKAVALLAALWGAWGFLGGLFDLIVAPLGRFLGNALGGGEPPPPSDTGLAQRSEEHTSELQSQSNLVCRLLLEKKKKNKRHSQQ